VVNPFEGDLRGVWSGDGVTWIVGPQGTILRVDSDGLRHVDSGVETDLSAVWAFSEHDAWAVGAGGLILHWDGDLWAPVESGTTTDLLGIWGAASNDIWVVGGASCNGEFNEGVILHGDGRQWTTAEEGLEQAATAVWGSATDDVWAVGFGNGFRHWDGESWSFVYVPDLPQPVDNEDHYENHGYYRCL